MDFSNIKRVVAWTSVGIALVTLVVFWGPLAYRMATGGGITCGPSGNCYDRFCLFFWSGFQIVATILLASCWYYCSTLDTEEKKRECRYLCWLTYMSWLLISILLVGLLCSRPSP